MTDALDGIRVLELSLGPAAALSGMVMADFGAQVIRVNSPDSDVLSTLPAAPMWHRGKGSVELNLNEREDLEQFRQLCAGADVLLTNWRMNALTKKGLDPDTLRTAYPHLVYTHIGGFGNRGPLADMPGYEHLIAAYSGRMLMFQGLVDRPGPIFSALQVGIHACAQAALAGTLAALLARGQTGHGRLVETSLLQGMLPYEQGPMLGTQFKARFPDLLAAIQTPTPEPPMPSLFYHPAQAGDGRWLQFGNLLPHLFDNFLIATELVDIIADPDFHAKQLMLKDPQKHEAFRERMLLKIQERTADEWMQQFIADAGIVATAYQTTQQAMHDPDIVANGHTITIDEVEQLGPLARLTATPANPGRTPDPQWAQLWQSEPRPSPSGQATVETELPLRGVKVLELATIIAAPLGATMLVDMGADVIKVEQIGGDPFRGMLSGIGSARVNAGKRSISINLKSAEGRSIVMTLAADADVVIHNFRPGVPERLGIDYEQIKQVNPQVVYLQSNGYGPDGPGALRPSTHPIPGAAMGGVYFQLGERVPQDVQSVDALRTWTARLMRANEVNPDPNTAMVVTSSVMLGLVARQQNGYGQQILIDMFGANAYANHDDFLNYPGKPHRTLPDEGLHGLAATYRLYPCAEEQWVFLALVTAKEQARFISALHNEGLATLEDSFFESSQAQQVQKLTALFAQRDATFWQSLGVRNQIGCVRADAYGPNEFWLNDDQVDAMNLTLPVSHPTWGDYRRHGPTVHFDEQSPALGPPPLAGQHNTSVLQQAGYPEEQIASWLAEGVIWQES